MTGNREGRTVIHEMVEKLIKEYQPKKIILFGSYAYGEVNRDSDIDLLIIKNTDKKPIDRWVEVKRLLRDTTRTFPVAPLVYEEIIVYRT